MSSQQQQLEDDDRRRRWVTIAQGLGIIAVGSGLSFMGFRYGLKKQLDAAKESEQVVVDQHKVGPSGVPARQLAVRALARSSAVAIVLASFAGIGLSYWVESRQKPISKEQNEQELKVLWKALGVDVEAEGKSATSSEETGKQG